jgi:hypothetical protein
MHDMTECVFVVCGLVGLLVGGGRRDGLSGFEGKLFLLLMSIERDELSVK